MGVYIKGVEMPTRCCDCKMYVEVYCCHLLNKEIENPWADDGVELDCPLIPVPPHGRLIDADALDIHRREEQAWHYYEQNPDNEYLEGVKDGLHEAAKLLSVAPTIIPAEEATQEDGGQDEAPAGPYDLLYEEGGANTT